MWNALIDADLTLDVIILEEFPSLLTNFVWEEIIVLCISL
jgi:hypothetical protein